MSPFGEYLAGPLYDREGILCADIDLSDVVRAKLDFDVVGNYARPDVFRLEVNELESLPVTYKKNPEKIKGTSNTRIGS